MKLSTFLTDRPRPLFFWRETDTSATHRRMRKIKGQKSSSEISTYDKQKHFYT